MILDLKPYAEYKESGLPWLGQVPAHWGVRRLKSHLLRNDAGVWSAVFDERGTTVLRSTEQSVDGGWRIVNPARLLLNESQKRAALLDVGDLVITKSSGSALHIGKTSLVTLRVAEMQCCFSNFMQRLRVSQDVSPRFAWILLNSRVGREQFVYQSTTTTGLGNLNGTILGNCTFAFPPPDEQAAIVRFLDWANGRLERAIRAKRKVIALLNEQKQAIIHRAVTRGLDPTVPLKPSGIPWLGDIPQHWEVRRLGHAIRLQTGFPFASTGFVHGESGTRLLRGINVTPSGIRWDEAVRWQRKPGDSLDEFALEVGDIALGMDRPIIGSGVRAAPIRENDTPSLLLQRVARLRPTNNLDAKFLLLLLRGRLFRDYIAPIFTGISVPHLSPQQIKGFRVPLPLLKEQQDIVRHLEVETSGLDVAASRLEREIELLREYRTRLVADVVTGKLDVREAAARLPDEAPLDTAEYDTDPPDEIEAADEEAAA